MIAPARDSLLVPMPEDGWEEVTELRKDEDHHWYCKRQFDSFYQDEAERRWTEAELLRPGDLCETKIFGKWRCGKACAFHVDKSDNMKAVIFMKFEGKLNRIQSTVRVVPKILYTDLDDKHYLEAQFVELYGEQAKNKMKTLPKWKLGDRCEMFVHKCWVPGVIRDIILPEKINGQRSGRILAKLDIMDELQEGFRMRKPQGEDLNKKRKIRKVTRYEGMSDPEPKWRSTRIKRSQPQLAKPIKSQTKISDLSKSKSGKKSSKRPRTTRKRPPTTRMQRRREKNKPSPEVVPPVACEDMRNSLRDIINDSFNLAYFIMKGDNSKIDRRRGPPLRFDDRRNNIFNSKKLAEASYSDNQYTVMATDDERTACYRPALERHLEQLWMEGQKVIHVVDIGTGALAFWLSMILDIYEKHNRDTEGLLLTGIEVSPQAAAKASSVLSNARRKGKKFEYQIVKEYSTHLGPSRSCVEPPVFKNGITSERHTIPKKVDILVQEVLGGVAGTEGVEHMMKQFLPVWNVRFVVPERAITRMAPATFPCGPEYGSQEYLRAMAQYYKITRNQMMMMGKKMAHKVCLGSMNPENHAILEDLDFARMNAELGHHDQCREQLESREESRGRGRINMSSRPSSSVHRATAEQEELKNLNNREKQGRSSSSPSRAAVNPQDNFMNSHGNQNGSTIPAINLERAVTAPMGEDETPGGLNDCDSHAKENKIPMNHPRPESALSQGPAPTVRILPIERKGIFVGVVCYLEVIGHNREEKPFRNWKSETSNWDQHLIFCRKLTDNMGKWPRVRPSDRIRVDVTTGESHQFPSLVKNKKRRYNAPESSGRPCYKLNFHLPGGEETEMMVEFKEFNGTFQDMWKASENSETKEAAKQRIRRLRALGKWGQRVLKVCDWDKARESLIAELSAASTLARPLQPSTSSISSQSQHDSEYLLPCPQQAPRPIARQCELQKIQAQSLIGGGAVGSDIVQIAKSNTPVHTADTHETQM